VGEVVYISSKQQNSQLHIDVVGGGEFFWGGVFGLGLLSVIISRVGGGWLWRPP
jgi:hypothetical protein